MAGAIASAVIGGIASNSASKRAAAAQQEANNIARQQLGLAQDQWNSYKQTYQPLEQKLVADAQNYDTKERRNAAASEAAATVGSELGKAQQRLQRTVGFDPSSAAAQAAQTNLALTGAAMGATTQNAARQKVQDTAFARQMDALGLGKGLVANASTGFANAANAANTAATNQMNMANAQGAAAGQLAGMAIGGLSKVNWSNFFGNGGSGGPVSATTGLTAGGTPMSSSVSGGIRSFE